MMLKCFYILIWIGVFKLSFCQQRMGHESVSGKNYLVYFVKSPYSKADDNAWICAGAIVTPTQILTAASCLTEMQKIYAIAGYKKYVHGEDIDKDNCTTRYKKKIIKISVPKEYNVDATANQPDWISMDIGIAYVQEPYDFSDTSYRIYCSYEPQSIIINFEKINQFETNQAVAVGWGGKQVISGSSKGIFLQEANTTIIDKRTCSNLVSSPESMELVDKYILCASGSGFKAEDGLGTTLDPILSDCPPDSNGTDPRCLDEFTFRRINGNETKQSGFISRRSTGRACQNDHGGPLISWIGTQEVMLGVALNGAAKMKFDCAAPRMYVSTSETEKIIKCLLETNDVRRSICNDEIGNQKYQIVDIDIKWPEDVAFNLSSLLSDQKVSSFLRQGNEEQPLHVRPTKDLGNPDESGNPRQPGEQLYNQMDQKRENSYYLNQPMDQGQGPQNAQYTDQQGQMQQSQMDLHNQPPPDPYNQAPIGSFNQPQIDPYNQPPFDPQNQPQADGYNQPQLSPYNPPPVDTYNQPQTDQQNQPQSDPYGQLQSFNQPQVEPFNQQPADPYNQPIDPYNQPQPNLYNQPPMETQNQTPVDLHNQPQDQMFNKPAISQPSFKPPQDPYNEPEVMKPPQIDPYNQQQPDSFKPAQGNPYNNHETDSYKQAQSDLYGNQPQRQFKQPQTKSEIGTFKESQPKIEPYDQTQDSFQDPKSSLNIPPLESFKPPAASDTYNPLSIISENQPDDGDSFKLPMDAPFKPSPVEPYKQLSSDSSYNKQEPFKPAPVEPYEQPNMRPVDQGRQRIQPFDQTHVQPGEPPRVQPYGQPQMQGPSQTTDSSQSRTGLRYQQGDSQGESQTFEQMYSQLHAGGESPLFDKAPVTEQTFEEMYKTLHDGSSDGTHDAEMESRGEQPFEIKGFDQPAFQPSFDQPTMEQPAFNQPQYSQPSFNQPQYEQPSFSQPQFDQPIYNQAAFDQQSFHLNKQPEQQYDRNRHNNMPPPQAAEQRDEVQVRPQMPLDYPDYVSYNKRRRNT